MGMFDNVECDYPLPNAGTLQGETFQTKSFDNLLDNYTITKDGDLIWHKVRMEEVPEEERPYYGKPEWDNTPLAKVCGSFRTVPDGNEKVDFHGVLNMYTIDAFGKWYEYDVYFVYGKVDKIEKVERDDN